MRTSSLSKLLALILILFVGLYAPSFSQKSEKLFQKGLVKEEGEGSLQEAIDIYNQVVDDASVERSLRAKALLHVGICYEKLGQERAKSTYEKLIADFADQEEIVAIGKKKLSHLGTGIKATRSDELIIRQVWAPAEDTYAASPDGRYLTYIDWVAIELCVKDLKTGKTWNITNRGTWKPPMQFPDNSIWAPDSKQIAYYWFNGDTTELRIASIDGSEDRVLCNGKGNNTPWPVAWSNDGKQILAFNSSGDETNPEAIVSQIVLVAVDDGTIHVLNSFEGLESACCGDISPDNQYIVYSLQQEKGSENNDVFLIAADGSYEERIIADPSNDKNALWMPDGNGIIFISDRMGTKDLWSLQLNDGKPAGEPEILKSNLGERTHLLRITEDESLFYVNSYMRSDVFIASMDFMSGKILAEPNKISSIKVEKNTKPFWSPDGRYLAYIVWPSHRNSALGYRYEFIIYDSETGSDRKLTTDLYGSGGNYWLQPRWSPDGKSFLVHGRTDEDKIQGFFLVDVNTAGRTPILVKKREPRTSNQPIGNFPMFFNGGEDIIYLSSNRKEIITRNIATKQEKTIHSGEDEILYYKLSPDGSQIVFGYFFNNRYALYIVPFSGGEKRKLLDSKEKDTPYVISWTADSKYVIFESGAYGNKEPHEILRVPVNGGDPERVVLLEDLFSQKGEVRNIEIHPDGKQVAIDMITGQGVEIWALENLFRK